MQPESPNLWQYTPANSPLPLPEGPILVTKKSLHYLSSENGDMESKETLNLSGIQKYCSQFTCDGESIDSIFSYLLLLKEAYFIKLFFVNAIIERCLR